MPLLVSLTLTLMVMGAIAAYRIRPARQRDTDAAPARLLLPVVATCFLAAVATLATRPVAAAAADPTMFDEGRAQSAFKTIEDKVGHKFRVLGVTIRATELTVTIPSTDSPGQAEVWGVSQRGVLGALGLDSAVLVRTERAQIISGTLEENLIGIDSDGISIVPKLAIDAVARARMQTPSDISRMELRRLPKIVEPGVRDPSWLVHVEGVGEDADISAKPTGEITFADVGRTLRAKKLNLLAGGPDLDEMIDNIRREVMDKWTFHYIEIGKGGIDFDVTLNSVGDRARMTRFHAGLNGIKTDNLSMPRSGYMNMPADPPFDFKGIDWSMLPKVEQAAQERLGIADGVMQRVRLTKPERVGGGNGVEWEVDVKSAKAPLFWNPSQPPVEEGSVGFDMKGNVLRTKYPPGRGPRDNLFTAVDLQKAVDTIKKRLGPHLQVVELLITGDSIDVTAQDPKNPKNFAIFTYKNEDVTRADDIRAGMIKSFGAGPSWLWDLDLLQPATLQPLATMEQQTMAHWKIANGHVTRITISKDKMFHATNNRPLIEIRVAGEDNNDQWVYFDFAGNITDPDRPSGGAASGTGAPAAGGASRDHQECTGSDPERVIAGCTRMTQNPNESPHNRAIAFYNRGGIYKERKDYDRAIADYGETIKLDPQYANAYINRGMAYDAKGDNDAAIADFGRVIELKPSDPLAYYNRGYVRCWKKRDYDGAIADLSKAIDLGSKDSPTYFYRAMAYQGKKDYRHAIADYDEGLKQTLNKAIGLSYRGASYEGLSDFDHALADYDAAIKLDPKYAAAYANRGHLRRNQGDIAAAIADYGEAIKLEPTLNYAYVSRGSAYRARGEFDRAVTDYGVAIKANPKYAAAIFNRGFAYFLAGALPKALADLAQANALDPADAYTVLTLDIVGQKSKLQSNMAQLSGKLDMTGWPAPVIRLFLGQSTQDAVMAASDDPDPTTKRGHVCEANYYAGEIALLHGDRDGAIKFFNAASADCPSRWTEWEAADAELKMLGLNPPPGKR